MSISIRLSNIEVEVIRNYANINNLSISEVIHDLKSYKKAIAEFKKNPSTHTLADVKKDLGFDKVLFNRSKSS